ncbi:Phosphorylated carbohydrates phosphatase [Ananas comosus]|uniref:Phosphorylated carbohydrates phosphatase n=1 Tax=Ananas comosus TaxID=4615 RepID=A0A199UQ80_ANACO|nr:Phosphorylated carbohydrates phosphatase [Ananas comosus]
MDGPLKVDVDYLNNKLQECFLQRIRHAMKPDEAFGLIFSWDNVVADTRSLKLDAWRQLALEEGKDLLGDGHVQRNLLQASADHVLRKVLRWVGEESELERLKSRLVELYYENFLKLEAPMDGLKDWLDAVHTAGIPCAVVSSIERRCLVEALNRMGLTKYFQAIVSEEDGMDSIAHRFLSAAIKLDRKPSKCVVFEDDPRGIAAAHNCTMMAVALIGPHPAYELVQADLAVARFSELSVINLRRLFAVRGSSFMDLQKQPVENSPPKRRLRIDTIF